VRGHVAEAPSKPRNDKKMLRITLIAIMLLKKKLHLLSNWFGYVPKTDFDSSIRHGQSGGYLVKVISMNH
jgi:hypothetical protein